MSRIQNRSKLIVIIGKISSTNNFIDGILVVSRVHLYTIRIG